MLHHIEVKRTETAAANSVVFLIGSTFLAIFLAAFFGSLFSFYLFLNVALNKVKFYYPFFFYNMITSYLCHVWTKLIMGVVSLSLYS